MGQMFSIKLVRALIAVEFVFFDSSNFQHRSSVSLYKRVESFLPRPCRKVLTGFRLLEYLQRCPNVSNPRQSVDYASGRYMVWGRVTILCLLHRVVDFEDFLHVRWTHSCISFNQSIVHSSRGRKAGMRKTCNCCLTQLHVSIRAKQVDQCDVCNVVWCDVVTLHLHQYLLGTKTGSRRLLEGLQEHVESVNVDGNINLVKHRKHFTVCIFSVMWK
mmetsp:Transcript_21021/g.85764  ORF Transcript_21021/g.85764 Transcript_21021/m.85764 type:complete len:216 (+) Transcript_21021:2474-3121(+)